MEILRVENLTKVYGKDESQVVALDNVSFSVKVNPLPSIALSQNSIRKCGAL